MYKALCVAVLLLGTIALTGRNSTAAPVGPAYPLIAAKGKLLNQTGPLAQTTIFTPSASGMYRLSVAGSITTAATTTAGMYGYNLYWTDVSGVQNQVSVIAAYDGALGCWCTYYPYPTTLTFAAQAGTPVSHSIVQMEQTDNSVYAIYYTIERLE
jgi:hypothetical protein